MQIDLTGKKALVTGASRGLGRAIALSLARAGADVVITYEKSVDKAQQVVDEINALGRHGEAIQADSASAQAIQDAVTQAARALGGLDILVNNAGIARGGPLESMTLGGHRRSDQRQHPRRGDRHSGSAGAYVGRRTHHQHWQLSGEPRGAAGDRRLLDDQVCP